MIDDSSGRKEVVQRRDPPHYVSENSNSDLDNWQEARLPFRSKSSHSYQKYYITDKHTTTTVITITVIAHPTRPIDGHCQSKKKK